MVARREAGSLGRTEKDKTQKAMWWEFRVKKETAMALQFWKGLVVCLIITSSRKADLQQKCFIWIKSTELSVLQIPPPQHRLSKRKHFNATVSSIYSAFFHTEARRNCNNLVCNLLHLLHYYIAGIGWWVWGKVGGNRSWFCMKRKKMYSAMQMVGLCYLRDKLYQKDGVLQDFPILEI